MTLSLETTTGNGPLAPALAHVPTCTKCDLHEGCRSVCIPTRYLPPISGSPVSNIGSRPHCSRVLSSSASTRGPQALLVVGEAPGEQEDLAGQCFVGPSGRMLNLAFIQPFKFSDDADVYLTNIVRCRPPQNADPTARHFKACREYFHHDLVLLLDAYSSVTLLVVGAVATSALFGGSLKELLYDQGRLYSFKFGGREYSVPVYGSSHPANLLGSRSPAAMVAVHDHLTLLKRRLSGSAVPTGAVEHADYQLGGVPSDCSLLSLDIETYGCLKGWDQTVFHPAKSRYVDRVPYSRMIVTVALTAPSGSHVYIWSNYEHRAALRTALSRCSHILGQNILFDLLYLRYCDPIIRTVLDNGYLHGTIRLWDLAITNYLHNEQQPERSLKALSPLFGFGKYEKEELSYEYASENDDSLHLYNVRDTVRTRLLDEFLRESTKTRYGDKTDKLSEYCIRWYSDLLWSVLFMAEYGTHFDIEKLTALNNRTQRHHYLNLTISERRYGKSIVGRNSQKFIIERMSQIVDKLTPVQKLRLKKTEKTRRISTEDYNLQLLLLFSESNEDKKFLRLLRRFRTKAKLLDTYLKPLLSSEDPRRALRGTVYPSWHIVPSAFKDESGEREGGTNQSRLAAHSPPVQTFPASVSRCIGSRFPGGTVFSVDLSQIELKVAALLSNDTLMMEDCLARRDLHSGTTVRCFGPEIQEHPQFKAVYRQAGKRTNFLVLYRGQADKLQFMVFKDCGIRLPISQCDDLIRTFWRDHPGLFAWQETLVKAAARDGCIELPLIGQSKLFLGNIRAIRASINEIVNQPVQTIASNICQSAQIELERAFRKRKLCAMCFLSVHDAVKIDCPPLELPIVIQLVNKIMPDPPFYRDLCCLLGRSLPLDFEIDSH